MNTSINRIGKWLALTLALLICQSLAAALSHFLLVDQLSSVMQSSTIHWPNTLLLATVDAALLYFIIAQLNVDYKKQMLVIFLFYWGCKYGQSLIEGLFYLNLWQYNPIMTLADLAFLSLLGLFTCVLICPLAVFIVGNLRPSLRQDTPKQNKCSPVAKTNGFPFSLSKVIWVGLIYVPVYLIAGICLAIPLGGEGFNETYATLQVPLWMPLFQWARGIFWALQIWMVLAIQKPSPYCQYSTLVGVPCFIGLQLILPNPYITDTMRYAHLIEVLISMAVYAWLAIRVFRKRPTRDEQYQDSQPVKAPASH